MQCKVRTRNVPGSPCNSGILDTWGPAAYTLIRAAIAVAVFMNKAAAAMMIPGGANSFSSVMVAIVLVFFFCPVTGG